jgi:hypothetical protein
LLGKNRWKLDGLRGNPGNMIAETEMIVAWIQSSIQQCMKSLVERSCFPILVIRNIRVMAKQSRELFGFARCALQGWIEILYR